MMLGRKMNFKPYLLPMYFIIFGVKCRSNVESIPLMEKMMFFTMNPLHFVDIFNRTMFFGVNFVM
jgi:hypothetical protein